MHRLAAIGIAAGILTAPGCGSRADHAARDWLDIAIELEELKASGERITQKKMSQVVHRMTKAAETLDEEVAKMSDEERKAFQEKWTKRFREAGLGSPPDRVEPSRGPRGDDPSS